MKKLQASLILISAIVLAAPSATCAGDLIEQGTTAAGSAAGTVAGTAVGGPVGGAVGGVVGGAVGKTTVKVVGAIIPGGGKKKKREREEAEAVAPAEAERVAATSEATGPALVAQEPGVAAFPQAVDASDIGPDFQSAEP